MIMAIMATNAFSGQTPPPTTDLIIHIKGFENSNGIAKVGLSNSKANYESKTPFKGFNFKISNNEVVETISLPLGEYAIKVYHDENENHELDTRIFGIPAERYGFSNDARGSFGPPEYDAAAFKLDSNPKEITITIQ
ncbi:MAG: DUF2141 domain-containing protein [Desulfobacteraceae bacterium]|nr:DUF2141 domain-containing protein [Desulfobacteraceae bacterium]